MALLSDFGRKIALMLSEKRCEVDFELDLSSRRAVNARVSCNLRENQPLDLRFVRLRALTSRTIAVIADGLS